jgi:hypothetical protein
VTGKTVPGDGRPRGWRWLHPLSPDGAAPRPDAHESPALEDWDEEGDEDGRRERDDDPD